MSKTINCLEKLGNVKSVLHPELKKNAWIHSDYKDSKKAGRLQRSHTKKIQEKVIKPWLEQLPTVSGERGIVFQSKDKKLSVEKEPLFDDFRNHVKFTPNPFDLMDKYKEKAVVFREKKESLRNVIISLLEKEVRPLLREKTRFISPSGRKWENETITPSLVGWVYDAICTLAVGKQSEYGNCYANFSSKIKATDNSFKYFLNRKYGCVKIKKREKKKDFREEMDKKITNIIEKVTLNPEYIDKAISIINIVEELKDLEKKIRLNLKKHLWTDKLPRSL